MNLATRVTLRRPWGRYSGVSAVKFCGTNPKIYVCILFSVRTPASWSALGLFFVLCRWPSWPVPRALRLLSLISQSPRGQAPQDFIPGRGFKSAFLPCHRVKMHLPKSCGILPRSGSDFRSRSPLSIGALRSARNDRIRLWTVNS